MLPKEYISYNQIRQYQTCPKKYYYSYIDNIQTPVNSKIYLGIIYHSAIEYFFKKKADGIIIEKEKLISIFLDYFRNTEDRIEVIWENEKNKPDTKNRGMAFITYFYNEFSNRIEPFLIEEEMETELEDLGIKLKGIPDLIEKDFSITDFKTTTAKWSKSRINQSLLQMIIYKYLFEKHYGKVNNKLKFRIVYAKDASNVKHQELIINSRDITYHKMFEIIKHTAEQISLQRYPKKEGFYCRFCEYKSICLS